MFSCRFIHYAARDTALYARCGALEGLAYGIETGEHAYATKSLEALGWLFPAGAGDEPSGVAPRTS